MRRNVWILILFAIPIGGILVPLETVESFPAVCLYRLIGGLECWGCGMTRAISAMLHGEVVRAVELNPRVLVVFPLLVWIWARALFRALGNSPLPLSARTRASHLDR